MPVNMMPPSNPEHKEMMALLRENNKMLKQIRRAQRVNRVFRILYWVVIIGAAVGIFYYLQPFIEQVMSVYGALADNVTKPNGIGIPGLPLDNLLHFLPGGGEAATTTGS